ncbi:MAG: hypothetical protein NTX71_07800 [Candidatus Aureabacteria bacterium]|nr:hypothetical protein [Candidatus Auribacterota bacterium]
METTVAVGARIEHRTYGIGNVLGLSEKKEVIRIRFEKAGVKELPYPCPDLVRTVSPEGAAGERVLRMHFDGASRNGPGCRWVLQFSGAPVFSLVQGIHTWATNKAKLNGASVNLKAIEKQGMELRISGQGRDGRCRWCRTFRSGLKTAVLRGYGSRAFALDGSCVFDQASGGAAGDSGRKNSAGPICSPTTGRSEFCAPSTGKGRVGAGRQAMVKGDNRGQAGPGGSAGGSEKVEPRGQDRGST